MKAVMERLGLMLNEAKTSLKNARRERFDFLGYWFGPYCYKGNGQWYEVPHMSTRKPRLQLKKFAINGPKRLLQQNLPGTDMRHLSDSQVGGPTDERKRRYQSDR